MRFELAGTEEAPVQLLIYDVTGKRVRSLIDASIAPGEYEVTWDGRSDGGGRVAAGVYYYRLVTATSDETRKMVLLK
jgi:flagellar hook assembly protein FlgD